MWDNVSKWINGDSLSHVNEREFHAQNNRKCPRAMHLDLKLEIRCHNKQLKLSLQQNYFDEALKSAKTTKQKWQKIKEFWPFLKKNTKINNISNCTDEAQMSDILNEFFTNIGNNLLKIKPYNINPINMAQKLPVFEFRELDILQIAELIRNLRPSSLCGVDDLTANVIKAAGPSLFPVLLHLFNTSVLKSQFPTNWRIGCITPPPL